MIIPELRVSTDQLSEFRSHITQQLHITRSREAGLNQHTQSQINAPVFNVNNNVNLRFDTRTKKQRNPNGVRR